MTPAQFHAAQCPQGAGRCPGPHEATQSRGTWQGWPRVLPAPLSPSLSPPCSLRWVGGWVGGGTPGCSQCVPVSPAPLSPVGHHDRPHREQHGPVRWLRRTGRGRHQEGCEVPERGQEGETDQRHGTSVPSMVPSAPSIAPSVPSIARSVPFIVPSILQAPPVSPPCSLVSPPSLPVSPSLPPVTPPSPPMSPLQPPASHRHPQCPLHSP